MGWQEQYKSRLCTAEEAVRHIEDGDAVVLAHCVGEPPVLVEAMVANAAQYKNVEVKHMVSLGNGGYAVPGMEEHFRADPLFVSPNTRNAIIEGRADFTPAFFHEVPLLLRQKKLRCDVVMAQVTPPDEDGYCSLGTSVDYTYQAIKSAKIVIVQVNDQFPRTYGEKVHISEFDYIVEASTPVYESKPTQIGELEKAIGANCVSLIEDGSTLQLGIGGIPDAVIQLLGDRKNLGIHSEMISDGTLALYEKGVINGKFKKFDQGKMTVTFLMGSRKLYDFAHNNPEVEVRPVDYVNHPAVIMKQNKMVCINSAIQVDLMGQVAAESIGLKQFSGVGGQVDFIRGASMAEDGKSIIAMASYTKKKDGSIISKIAPFLDHGAAVTTSRNDIDYVVTECGIAELKGKSLRERARSLINISHESAKEELQAEFEKRFHEKFYAIAKDF
ncbi:acetyl-CoA hydrolase/transferase family protein [Sinanaerobacter sp. ZZT-01]|uniref:acetyl-CoA hydrolase/transferase family protein n=1 Tax=Sinanaerobacter sp. ZZT-01 TaxID=3111540 RepID=UPI002D777D79|nr:acetyl-CoA hydrolase/transferase C-terminal domain-containing protein [Sinanaerobacter sp. ZZT-01]WRR94281.1 acetyl-CoA hydrolase/transferase C-terminal domain-containing protein [Sinanaerobacter sp. ZZT-01]